MKPGEQRPKKAICRRRVHPELVEGPPTQDTDPKPYDEDWDWWMERRLENLENGQKWLIRLAAGIPWHQPPGQAILADSSRLSLPAGGLRQ